MFIIMFLSLCESLLLFTKLFRTFLRSNIKLTAKIPSQRSTSMRQMLNTSLGAARWSCLG